MLRAAALTLAALAVLVGPMAGSSRAIDFSQSLTGPLIYKPDLVVEDVSMNHWRVGTSTYRVRTAELFLQSLEDARLEHRMTIRIRNRGNFLASGDIRIGVQVTPTNGSRIVRYFTRSVSIRPGSSTEVWLYLPYDMGLRFSARVDVDMPGGPSSPYGAIRESDETNNYRVSAFEFRTWEEPTEDAFDYDVVGQYLVVWTRP